MDRARALTASISLPAAMLAVTSTPTIQLSDEELVQQGLLAEFTNQRVSDIIQARQAASYETSLTMRSISSMFNYIAMWAHLYDVQVIRTRLNGYDLTKFSNLENLRQQLIADTRGKLFWDKYWKAGVMSCVLVGASAMAIFTAGFGAPVSAFLVAQFTASPTIATTLAAGGMLVLTSSIMWLDGNVRKAFRRVRGLPPTPEPHHAPVQPGGTALAAERVHARSGAAQPESALQLHRGIPLDPTHPAPPERGGKRPVHMERQVKPSGTKLHGSGAKHITSERPGRWPKTQVTRVTESALRPQTGIPLDPTHPGSRLHEIEARHTTSERPRRLPTITRKKGVADTPTSTKA